MHQSSDGSGFLCESGKANLGILSLEISKVKYSVVVDHKCIPQDPEWGVTEHPDATNASGGAFIVWTLVKALCHGEVLAIELEGNLRKIRVAGESVESVGVRFRTRDLLIEQSNIGGITNDKGSSLEDNVSQAV
jgi:hypothetical protein